MDPVLEGLIVEKSPLFAQLLGEFKEHDDDAYQMLCVAIKKLTADVRFQMEDEAYQMACLEEILRDLSVAYMEERMDSWEPDLEGIIQKHLA
jgi:hypothetical protein